jgi:hypothetical protein
MLGLPAIDCQNDTVTRLEEAARFGVPVEFGFDYITDVGNWPAYWPGLLEIAEPEPRWSRPGDELHLVVRFLSGPVEMAITLEEFRPPSRVAYRSVQSGLPAARHERHFRADDDGFEYRLVVELERRRGLASILDRTLVAWGVRRALRKTIENLRDVLE